ncbi:FAD-dependent monooxygenase [Cupriavidus necator]|uniref:FAD-dependent monooxygenase n=1 Tax=Cupriavidus necator TaxID=106590 RepID=UPI00068A7AF3|nr:FAD-dependent monooxygenase [Cupriavidus necator]
MRAAIIGGSLGGLTAALLLRDLGIQVDVYERSPAELVQRGAGIGFLPDAARYLVQRAGLVVCGAAQPFLQVIYDVEVPQMAFDRVCLIGDAAFVVRPHAAAGTAKAAADAWALAGALKRHGDVVAALADWEPRQLALGQQLLERTRRIGRRSQVDGNWVAGDPELIFGLHGPGA